MKHATRWKIIAILLLGLLVYLPSLFNYFSTDDWFLLRISRINDWREIIKFFSFIRNEYSAAFYRPLSQQIYLMIFDKLFGLNPLPYHIFGLICFGLSAFFVRKISLRMGLNSAQSYISMLIYMISSANFPRIYFISAFQDILFPLLGLISVWTYMCKKYFLSLIILVLALASKESAVALPGIWFLVDWYFKRINFKNYVIPTAILLVYIYFRIAYFGGAQGDSYIWNFSLKKFSNTLMWYGWWSLGVPEIMVDYVGSGLRILPKFFTELGYRAWAIIILVTGLVFGIAGRMLEKARQRNINYRLVIFEIGFFTLSLSTVLFLPWHKFAHHLGLPLAAVAMFIASLMNRRKALSLMIAIAFLGLNLQSHLLLLERHYSVRRAAVAVKVANYLNQNYKLFPKESPFLFVNDTQTESENWGSSKQIAYSLSISEFFKVFYDDKTIKVYYEDLDKEVPEKVTRLSSKIFLED